MNVKSIYLVEHSSVALFAGDILTYIHLMLEEAFKTTCTRLVKDVLYLSELEPEAIVFYAGQEGAIEGGTNTSYVVFICLSVFRNPRLVWGVSWKGRLELNRRKNNIEKNILPSADHILDYHPGHTHRLKKIYSKRLSIDWFPFGFSRLYGNHDVASIESQSKIWDLCIVGSVTPRRKKVYKHLSNLGLNLSPSNSQDLSCIISKSKVVLNIHAFKHDNIEFPRLLSAFIAGVPVLSEPCYSLEQVMPTNTLLISPLKDIAKNALWLCSDNKLRDQYAKCASKWYQSFAVNSTYKWKFLLSQIRLKALEKFNSEAHRSAKLHFLFKSY